MHTRHRMTCLSRSGVGNFCDAARATVTFGLQSKGISKTAGTPPEAELDYHVASEYLTKLIDPRLKADEAPSSLFSFKHHLVYELPTPEQIDDPELATGLGVSTNYSGLNFDEFMRIAKRERCVLAMVRVDRPLTPQFAAIERAVSARHPKLSPKEQKVKSASERRLLPEKFPFYLRLLDAKDVSAPKVSWAMIEQHILAEPAPFSVTRTRCVVHFAKPLKPARG